jgi:hypothetical protein
MILDLTELFSNAQAITATAASTNIIDTGAPGTVYKAAAALRRDMGKGNQIPLTLRVVQSFNNLTSLIVTYEVADDAAFTTNKTTVFTSPTYALADLATGARHLLPDYVPVGADRRYHRLLYTVAGTAPTLGQITAGFSMGNQTNSIL